MGEKVTLTKSLIIIMTIAAGVGVANLCYVQPLLSEIAKEFNIPESNAGILAMLVQIGYALGLFFLVPAGDILRRKKFIVTMFIIVSIMLLAVGMATNIYTFALFSFLVGFTTVAPQLILPFAAHLAGDENRGSVIGTVLGGIYAGLLVSRAFSGVVGDMLGWRWVYFIAAIVMIIFALIMHIALKDVPPQVNMRYKDIIKTMIVITKKEPLLRKSALVGGLMFGAFTLFWSSVVFLFESPVYNLGAKEAGLLGIIGVAGIIAAPIVGKISDTKGARKTIIFSILIGILGYIITGVAGYHIIGLIIGVIMLDIATQSGQVSNQSNINTLNKDERSRINSVFMVCYFIGGSIGSFLATQIFYYFNWIGVCVIGAFIEVLALIVYLKKK